MARRIQPGAAGSAARFEDDVHPGGMWEQGCDAEPVAFLDDTHILANVERSDP